MLTKCSKIFILMRSTFIGEAEKKLRAGKMGKIYIEYNNFIHLNIGHCAKNTMN